MITNIKWLFVCALVGFVSKISAENTKITAVMKSGEEKVMLIDETGAITFSDTNMKVLRSTSATEVSELKMSAIKKVLFEKDTYTVKVLSEGEIVLYPTVATEEVNLFNASDAISSVDIYNMNGQLVLKSSYVKDQSINISALPKGMYILKAGNENFKFEKK